MVPLYQKYLAPTWDISTLMGKGIGMKGDRLTMHSQRMLSRGLTQTGALDSIVSSIKRIEWMRHKRIRIYSKIVKEQTENCVKLQPSEGQQVVQKLTTAHIQIIL